MFKHKLVDVNGYPVGSLLDGRVVRATPTFKLVTEPYVEYYSTVETKQGIKRIVKSVHVRDLQEPKLLRVDGK